MTLKDGGWLGGLGIQGEGCFFKIPIFFCHLPLISTVVLLLLFKVEKFKAEIFCLWRIFWTSRQPRIKWMTTWWGCCRRDWFTDGLITPDDHVDFPLFWDWVLGSALQKILAHLKIEVTMLCVLFRYPRSEFYSIFSSCSNEMLIILICN